MQRYTAPSCTSAVRDTTIGGASVRDTSSLPNISLNSRRNSSQLTSYKLRCDKEPLNSRLGPPDFHPQTSDCPEETLTREYVQGGYKEIVEGIEEAREIALTQIQAFPKPVFLKWKEAIRKRLRAINESRAQKRKAGQVYGVPLSGTQLSKPGVFPEQKPCSEDLRKKWIEGLSQPHKRLRSLADHVPHGYRKKSLFEVLIKNNVPLLRATWFVKVTYLNQVRPGSASIGASILSGASDKAQFSRTELWTKDVIEYLQGIIDEIFSKNNSHSALHTRDRSPQVPYTGSIHHRSDLASAVFDAGEPSLHFKWWYMVQMLQWHHAEGLLLSSYIIDWVLNQLQDKELLEILQLLLPIIYGFIETLILSQTYVRMLVEVALGFIRKPPPGGSDLVDNSRRAYTASALVELLRYLIMAVPDTFVALDCFPLPSYVGSYMANDGNFFSKVSEDAVKTGKGALEVASVFRERGLDAQHLSSSFSCIVSSIQKRADNLAKASSPGYPGHNMAKAIQALDNTLVLGDLKGAYKCLFEELCTGAVDETWITEVSPLLRSSLKWIDRVSLSFICSVFFLCEWATSDFRDFRTAPPHQLKLTGGKDYSQIYIAIRILKLKIKDLQNSLQCKADVGFWDSELAKGLSQPKSQMPVGIVHEYYNSSNTVDSKHMNLFDLLESPGPLHDIIVCWIDQHDMNKGDGLKRLQLLIMELTRCGIFYPQAYARQLIVSGIMDRDDPQVEQDRRKKHYRVLKQLPEPYVREALEEGGIAEVSLVFEAMQVYANERRLVLRGLGHNRYKHPTSAEILSHKQKHLQRYGRSSASPTSVDQQKGLQLPSNFSAKSWKNGADIEELKSAISIFLQLPSSALSTVSGVDESKGSVRRYSGANYNKMDVSEGTPGCEECKRVKRQKISEEKSLSLQGDSPNLSDDEDSWWVKKGSKPFECAKVDPPLKPAKQASRGRQKIVRKTQSLAQLAATRIESSQGASTSHICDSRISCPHHRSALDGDISKSVEGVELTYSGNIASIGKVLKQLHFAEKRSISRWLISLVRELVEEAEKATPKIGQFNRSFSPPEERSFLRWKLGEDELSTILYLMDVSSDVVSAARFLLWLLPKVLGSPSTPIHGGRNMMTLSRTVESHVCEVGEAFLLSSIRRYENVLVATDLIPEALSATMYRAAALMASSGRVSSSSVVVYAKYLLKKYGTLPSVIDWEKNFKATCDKRFLSELETGRLQDVEVGYPLGVPTGVEDLDEYLRQKIGSGRLSRVALSMRDIVQRHVEDAFSYYLGKERKLYVAGAQKGATVDKWDDGHQIAKQIIMGLIECIRQTGGAAQEGDPSLVSSAVSAIVSNVGPSLSKVPDFPSGSICSSSPSSGGSLSFARRILHLHVACLCLLKEALGERHGRAFEIALATEATSALAGVFAPVKASRNQFQPSPEAHDSSANMSNDVLNNSAKVNLGRPAKIAAAVSALVVAAVIHGVSSLERMVTVFKLKEGLDVIHFMRSTRCNSNGNARSLGALKMDNPIEVYVHLFRLLVGNCRSVSDGLVVELVGEPSIVALMRMQRTLPLNLVFPPAYSIFAFVIWKTFIINNSSVAASEDMQQLYQSFTSAISDTIRHLPFRDICMGNTHGFYELVASDATESEFAAMLPHNGSDMHMKVMGFVPLRARLFLNCLIDCKMPNFIFQQDDFTLVTGIAESKVQYLENQANLLNKLVHVLDTLQPAKFHWQWVELRLLLNEQALIEKLETHDVSLVDALRSLSPTLEKASPSDNENNFIVIILTRLLVRPDAAPLFSEVVHRFGRSLEDSMLLQAKWFLGGNDVLLGRKSIRQRLINIAESKGFSTKAQLSKPWGWSKPSFTILTNKGDKKKFETTSLEEGEVVEETVDLKKGGKWSTQKADAEVIFSQQHLTERAFVELILPCIDQSSDESRKTFANDLIKQMSTIEQLINGGNRGTAKQAGTVTSGIEGPGNKVSNRKAIRSGSPGLARRQTGAADSVPLPSPAALRASIALRLQLLLRLLPIICADGEREPSGRNMRHVLASVILRLLGSRVVHENVDLPFSTDHGFSSPTEVQLRASAAASIDLSGEILFDRLLLVLHGLLSGCQPSWLKMRFPYKSVNESARNFPGFDRDVAENLQNDLDRMQLPDMIRWRIQTAMPVLLSPVRCSISCQPPSVSTAALVSLQSSISVPGVQIGNPSPVHRNTYSSGRPSNLPGKPKVISSQQDHDMEVDPWMLLEDGAGCGPTSSNTAAIGSSDHANLRASSWLKGTIRVRRTDLTYIGVIDDDS